MKQTLPGFFGTSDNKEGYIKMEKSPLENKISALAKKAGEHIHTLESRNQKLEKENKNLKPSDKKYDSNTKSIEINKNKITALALCKSALEEKSGLDALNQQLTALETGEHAISAESGWFFNTTKDIIAETRQLLHQYESSLTAAVATTTEDANSTSLSTPLLR